MPESTLDVPSGRGYVGRDRVERLPWADQRGTFSTALRLTPPETVRRRGPGPEPGASTVGSLGRERSKGDCGVAREVG